MTIERSMESYVDMENVLSWFLVVTIF